MKATKESQNFFGEFSKAVHDRESRLKKKLNRARLPAKSPEDSIPILAGGAAGGHPGFMLVPYADPPYKKKVIKKESDFYESFKNSKAKLTENTINMEEEKKPSNTTFNVTDIMEANIA